MTHDDDLEAAERQCSIANERHRLARHALHDARSSNNVTLIADCRAKCVCTRQAVVDADAAADVAESALMKHQREEVERWILENHDRVDRANQALWGE